MRAYQIFSLISAFSMMSMMSCSDEVKTPLAAAQGEVTDISYTSLSFAWDRVKDALQYDYELTSADGTLEAAGVTQDNYIEITGLTPATDYTLSVLAYAAVDGPNTTSAPLVLKATTLTARQLDTPRLVVEVEGRYANINWEAIADSEGYSYQLSRDGEIMEDGTTDTNELTLAALTPGAYVLTVKTEPSSDAFYDSEATVSFSIVSTELWRVSGVYTSALLDGSWPVTMIAYSDDSYELVDWYDTDGNNLCFYVDKFDEDAPYKLSDSQYEYDDDTEAYAVPVGRSGLPIVYVYPNNSRFSFSGDKDGGTLVVAVKSRNSSVGSAKRDNFVWGTNMK